MQKELIQFDTKKYHLEIYNFLNKYNIKEDLKITFQYITLKDGAKYLELYFNNKYFEKIKRIINCTLTSKNSYSFKDGYICIN